MIAMFKLFYNTIAACQRPVGPLLSNKCMYVLWITKLPVEIYTCIALAHVHIDAQISERASGMQV